MYQVGDRVAYRRRTGYLEVATVVEVQGDIVVVDCEDFGKVHVHSLVIKESANSFEAGSRDWVERAADPAAN